MLDEKKRKIREVTEKLQQMDERGIAIMTRDASTILMCQEMMEAESAEPETAAG